MPQDVFPFRDYQALRNRPFPVPQPHRVNLGPFGRDRVLLRLHTISPRGLGGFARSSSRNAHGRNTSRPCRGSWLFPFSSRQVLAGKISAAHLGQHFLRPSPIHHRRRNSPRLLSNRPVPATLDKGRQVWGVWIILADLQCIANLLHGEAGKSIGPRSLNFIRRDSVPHFVKPCPVISLEPKKQFLDYLQP